MLKVHALSRSTFWRLQYYFLFFWYMQLINFMRQYLTVIYNMNSRGRYVFNFSIWGYQLGGDVWHSLLSGEQPSYNIRVEVTWLVSKQKHRSCTREESAPTATAIRLG